MSANVDLESSARRFLTVLPSLEVSDKRILDLRCGGGEACLLLAQQGAREILGVDARDVSEARARLERADPQLQGRVRRACVPRMETAADIRRRYQRHQIRIQAATFAQVAVQIDVHGVPLLRCRSGFPA